MQRNKAKYEQYNNINDKEYDMRDEFNQYKNRDYQNEIRSQNNNNYNRNEEDFQREYNDYIKKKNQEQLMKDNNNMREGNNDLNLPKTREQIQHDVYIENFKRQQLAKQMMMEEEMKYKQQYLSKK